MIERGAVIGKELWAGAVAELMPDDARPFVERHLEALVRKELLTTARSVLRGERAFAFHHILIQKAAYRAVPKELRASLHVRFGDWLQRVAAADEYAEIAGFHLERAHRLRLELGIGGADQRELAARAADRLALAGRRAFRPGGYAGHPQGSCSAPRRCSKARRPSDRGLLSDLGYALFEIGEFGRADPAVSEAQRLARELGDRAVECSAEVKRGNISDLYRSAEHESRGARRPGAPGDRRADRARRRCRGSRVRGPRSPRCSTSPGAGRGR